MSLENEKCVIVMDEGLPLGLIANTAAILGITLGKTLPEVVGAAVEDASGQSHLGIIEFPVPILRSTSEAIKVLRERLYLLEFQELPVFICCQIVVKPQKWQLKNAESLDKSRFLMF